MPHSPLSGLLAASTASRPGRQISLRNLPLLLMERLPSFMGRPHSPLSCPLWLSGPPPLSGRQLSFPDCHIIMLRPGSSRRLFRFPLYIFSSTTIKFLGT